MSDRNPGAVVPPLPAALESKNPARWLAIFGPGAVIASLTIGAGELIFSSRAGALFGYRLLWFFLLILALKWVLVYAAARHMVLTGAHPFQRWMELPGPRGWLPLVFLLLAVICFPIWVGFHAGTVGTLLGSLTGTGDYLRGTAHLVWGMAVLGLVVVLVATGGYGALERIQLVIVLIMLGGTVVSLILLRPDWLEMLGGLLLPREVSYPDWALSHTEFVGRPIWLEAITYVGILGGSGYDYLAYVSYLREKAWGRAALPVASEAQLVEAASNPDARERRWLRAVAVDTVLSFLAVLVFAAVFVACGAMVLGPSQKVPGGTNLLALQAEYFTPLYPWLRPAYFAGAFLAMLGTLYGTIEVAPVVLREAMLALAPARDPAGLRRMAVGWVSGGGMLVLAGSLSWGLARGGANVPGLVALLTPANLFTGVLACGFICVTSTWNDWRHLPRGLRPGIGFMFLNGLAGAAFLILGMRGYWEYSGWKAFWMLAGTVSAGLGAAGWISRRHAISESKGQGRREASPSGLGPRD